MNIKNTKLNKNNKKHSDDVSVEDFAIYFLNLIKTQTEEVTRPPAAPTIAVTPNKSSGRVDKTNESSGNLSVLHETTSMCLETSKDFRTSTPVKSPGWSNNTSTPRKSYSRTMCLADFLVSPVEQRNRGRSKNSPHSRTMSAEQIKPKRRVVPLSVPKNPTSSEDFLTSSFRSDNNLETLMRQQRELDKAEGRTDERLLLRMHKDAISRDFETEKVDSRTPEPIKSSKVIIDLAAVTEPSTLNLFASIYSTLIDWNLVTNVLAEFAFLLNLLNADYESFSGKENMKKNPPEVLKSVNNCVFFAFGVLNRQRKLLALLDATTIRILLDNERLCQLQENLYKFLTAVHRHKVNLMTTQRSNTLPGNISANQGNVFYQQENDTRDNFPSGREFAAFKNQRDDFYKILRSWEVNHLSATWDFSKSLTPKVRQLLNVLPHPVNMAHLAKLFTAQLIISCSHEDAVSQLQGDLGANVDPNKLSKLTQRLTAPGHSSAELQFPGIQVFFRDFIVAAEECSAFVEQLKMALVAELIELNDAPFEVINFSNSEENLDEFNDIVVNPETIATSRTLAKFLGFTVSLPFPYENIKNSVIDSHQVTLRNLLLPQFDILRILQSAKEENKLMITIPWLVEYLSMLDHVALQLDYYRKVMDLLYSLHVDLGVGRVPMTPTCLLVLRLCLGWLFDRPNIPADGYYDFRRRQGKLLPTKPSSKKRKNGKRENERSFMKNMNPTLESLLNVACPFLGDFRLSVMPTRATKAVSRTGRYRHITTKVTTESSTKKSTEHDNQKILIDAFLQSQSPSMRKIVDFVTDRVTSAAIKNFQVLFFLDIKKATQKEIAGIRKENHEEILEDLKTIYTAGQEKLNKAWDEHVPEMIRSRVAKALDALLAIETLEAVQKTCEDIVIQRCLTKAEDWRNLHSKEISFLQEDLTIEAIKIAKNIHSAQHGCAINMELNVSGPLPSDVFGNLQKLMHKVSESPGMLSSEEFLSWFDDLRECLTGNTFVPHIYKYTGFMLHQLLLATIFSRTDLMTEELFQKAIECFKCEKFRDFVTPPQVEVSQLNCETAGEVDDDQKKTPEDSYIFAYLISPQNLEILQRIPSENVQKFSEYALNLLRNGLLTSDQLSEQRRRTTDQDWSEKDIRFLKDITENILKNFSAIENSPDILEKLSILEL
ncbi:Protein disks lost [Sergentomyia squamirostris]